MPDDEVEALASTFSPCLEFDLTPQQSAGIQEPDHSRGESLLIGSIQRREFPNHETFFFRGRRLPAVQVERLRRAARKAEPKTKPK